MKTEQIHELFKQNKNACYDHQGLTYFQEINK